MSLILSEQSGTAPPWLQSRDRPSLDYQAGKRLTADCLGMPVSSAAQGNARQVLSVCDIVFVCGKREKLPAHECASVLNMQHATQGICNTHCAPSD